MRTTTFFLLGFQLLGLVSLSACREDCPEPMEVCTDPTNVDCDNYDPCFGQSEVSAEFAIGEFRGGDMPDSLRWAESESLIYSPRLIRFRAYEESADSYTWYVGNEILHASAVERLFDDDLVGQEITISLVLEREPNLDCFPMDDGRDSVARSFVIVEHCDLPIVKRYRGLFLEGPTDGPYVAPTDSVEVEMQFFNPNNGQCSVNFCQLYNFDGGETWEAIGDKRLTSEMILFTGQGGNSGPEGVAAYDLETNSISAQYTYRGESWVFEGVALE